MEPLKTFLAWLLSPVVIGLGLQLLGFLPARRRGKIASRAFLVAGTAVLVLSSFPILTWSANRGRELSHPPFTPSALPNSAAPALVVVLGSGFHPDPSLPATARLDRTFTARLLEGVRVHRQLPDSRLLVSLPGEVGTVDEKRETLDELATILRLDSSRIHLLSNARSTLDEAILTADLLRAGETVIVATSAGHMPRALKIFAACGLEPIAAPTDFRHPRPGSPDDQPLRRWIPSLDGYVETEDWLYETSASLSAELGI